MIRLHILAGLSLAITLLMSMYIPFRFGLELYGIYFSLFGIINIISGMFGGRSKEVVLNMVSSPTLKADSNFFLTVKIDLCLLFLSQFIIFVIISNVSFERDWLKPNLILMPLIVSMIMPLVEGVLIKKGRQSAIWGLLITTNVLRMLAFEYIYRSGLHKISDVIYVHVAFGLLTYGVIYVAIIIMTFIHPKRGARTQESSSEFYKFFKRTYISSSIKVAHNNLDRLIIPYFGSFEILGSYAVVKTISSGISAIAMPLSNDMYSKLVHSKIDWRSIVNNQIVRYYPLLLLLTLLLAFMTAISMPYFYGVSIDSSFIILMICVFGSSLLNNLQFWVRPLVVKVSPADSIWINSLQAAVGISLTVISGLVLGIEGVLLAILLQSLFSVILVHLWKRKYTNDH